MRARDAARFGLLYLNGGSWRDRQIIPVAWIKNSSTTYSEVTDRSERGYGYLWWTLAADKWGADAISASGDGGQKIAVIPSQRLVVVENVDRRENPKGVPGRPFFELINKVVPATP
jgi:CubicO group peptidase (beta-lactamase class C family)